MIIGKERKKGKKDAVSSDPACCSVVSSSKRGRPKYVGRYQFFWGMKPIRCTNHLFGKAAVSVGFPVPCMCRYYSTTYSLLFLLPNLK